METKNLLKSKMAVVVFTTILILTGSLIQAQTVTTDQPDYYPGDTAYIFGEGWWAGEQVEILILCTLNPDIPFEAIVDADAEGKFYNLEFPILDEHLGEEFIVYAKGLSSGLTAGTTFTDSPKVGSVTVGAQMPNPVTAGSNATCTVTVYRGSGSGSTGAINLIFAVTSTLPAGVSASFTSLTIPNGVNSGTSTLTLSTTGSTPSGSFPFTVKATFNSGALNDYAFGNGTLNVCAPPNISVQNIGPVNTGANTCDASVEMGANITLVSGTTPVTYSYSLTNFGDPIANPYTFTAGTTTVYVKAENACGYEVESFTVTVANDLPVITGGEITAPADPIPLGDPVCLSAGFTDDNLASATWHISDDGTTYPVSGPGSIGTNTITGTFNLPAGVYSVKLVIEDHCGEKDSASYQYVVVYDPDGGFVTGGGWINSPAGALTSDIEAEGKASFGFVAKYKPGKNLAGEVDGNTNFQFTSGGFHFKSTSHEAMSLVIAGGKAVYKGTGTVNGSGSHKFLVSAIDGDVNGGGGADKFRIKIYADGSPNAVLYDNQMGASDNADATTVLGGGSIVIHTKTKSGEMVLPESPAGVLAARFSAYPNPFSDRLRIEFVPATGSQARIDMYDMTGRLVQTVFNRQVEAGVQYQAEFRPAAELSGTYICRFILGSSVQTEKIDFKK